MMTLQMPTLYTTTKPSSDTFGHWGVYVEHPKSKLNVVAPDVGGGFGSKIYVYPEEAVCTWASKKIKRPIKWTADRTQAFLSDAHGRDHINDIQPRLMQTTKSLAYVSTR